MSSAVISIKRSVEKFSVQRLIEITSADIKQRVAEFYSLVSFEHAAE